MMKGLRQTCCSLPADFPQTFNHEYSFHEVVESMQEVCGKAAARLLKVCGKAAASVQEVCDKSSIREGCGKNKSS